MKNTTMKTNNTLRYYAGNKSLGIDPAPQGIWEKGVFTLKEDDGPFKAGDCFLPDEMDLDDPSAFNDGTGGYNLHVVRQ